MKFDDLNYGTGVRAACSLSPVSLMWLVFGVECAGGEKRQKVRLGKGWL